MQSWLAVVIVATVIAVAIGVLFQVAFWNQPVTPELAMLFLIVGFLLALALRAVTRRRGGG